MPLQYYRAPIAACEATVKPYRQLDDLHASYVDDEAVGITRHPLVRIPRDVDQHSELMSITIPK